MKRKSDDREYVDQQDHVSRKDNNNNTICTYLDILDISITPEFYFLDVGCRTAQIVEWFYSEGAQSYGFDIGNKAASHWVDKKCISNLKQHDAHKPFGYDFQFDLISMTHVLEHCHSPELVLQHIRNCLKLGGKVWCTVPIEDSEFDHSDHAHYTIFTTHSEHIQMLESAGFTVTWSGIDNSMNSNIIATKTDDKN